MMFDELRNSGEWFEIPDDVMESMVEVSDKWVRSLPFETVQEMARRIHFYQLTKLFMGDKEKFDSVMEAYGVGKEDSICNDLNPITQFTIAQMDMQFGGFQAMNEEEMKKQKEEIEAQRQADATPLPDVEFFNNLGLS